MTDIDRNTPPPATQTTSKSVAAAFFLAFLFGPLGLLYASVGGGIIMILASFAIVPFTGGLGVFLIWPTSILWALIAAGSSKT